MSQNNSHIHTSSSDEDSIYTHSSSNSDFTLESEFKITFDPSPLTIKQCFLQVLDNIYLVVNGFYKLESDVMKLLTFPSDPILSLPDYHNLIDRNIFDDTEKSAHYETIESKTMKKHTNSSEHPLYLSRPTKRVIAVSSETLLHQYMVKIRLEINHCIDKLLKDAIEFTSKFDPFIDLISTDVTMHNHFFHAQLRDSFPYIFQDFSTNNNAYNGGIDGN